MNVTKLARSHAEAALKEGRAEPTEGLDHPNQHVRRVAWRLLGKPMPGDEGGRLELGRKLYPNHTARFERAKAEGKTVRLPVMLKQILAEH